jgi:hypothetical protein
MDVFVSVIGVIMAAWQDFELDVPPAERVNNVPFMLLLLGCCCVFFIIAIVVVIVVLVRRNTEDETFTIDESTTRTIPCFDCGGIVSRRADKCPHCGAPVSPIDPPIQDPRGN